MLLTPRLSTSSSLNTGTRVHALFTHVSPRSVPSDVCPAAPGPLLHSPAAFRSPGSVHVPSSHRGVATRGDARSRRGPLPLSSHASGRDGQWMRQVAEGVRVSKVGKVERKHRAGTGAADWRWDVRQEQSGEHVRHRRLGVKRTPWTQGSGQQGPWPCACCVRYLPSFSPPVAPTCCAHLPGARLLRVRSRMEVDTGLAPASSLERAQCAKVKQGGSVLGAGERQGSLPGGNERSQLKPEG